MYTLYTSLFDSNFNSGNLNTYKMSQKCVKLNIHYMLMEENKRFICTK